MSGLDTTGGCGTVFELSPNSNGGWVETILYSFQGGSDGYQPSPGLIFDLAGNLYGSAFGGGAYGSGAVFELSPNGSGGWTKAILYNFGSSSNDGAQPQSLIFDKSGNLYGTTLAGGENGCDHDLAQSCGTVFELSPNGSGGWTETLLYSFPSVGEGSEGYQPSPGLVFDQSGNLYGTTEQGGAGTCVGSGGCGTVFELSPNGSGSWTETLLHSFQGNSDGQVPLAGVIFDQSGNLYGTAEEGGAYDSGVVFKLSPNGSGGWTEIILYSFGTSTGYNVNPAAGLIFDSAGDLYSTTANGGTGTNCGVAGCGTIFELSPDGSGAWTETILYSFQGGNDGDRPASGVIFDQSGHLYGTTSGGGGTGCGGTGCGIVFEVNKVTFLIGAATGSSTSATISPGQSATFNLTVTPVAPFSGTVTFTCGITPPETPAPICSVPSSVNVTGSTASQVSVTVSTTALGSSGMSPFSKFPPESLIAAMLALFASSLLFMAGRRRLPALAASLTLFVLIAMTGCGGGVTKPTATLGTPAGPYTVTVTGTSGSQSQNMMLTVTVQ
jgi:uncharacterized repeat protein (TIGR03803 family)